MKPLERFFPRMGGKHNAEDTRMGPKTCLFVYFIFPLMLAAAPTVKAGHSEVMKAAFDKGGWVEFGAGLVPGKFHAQGEIEYTIFESRILNQTVKSRKIKAIHLTAYKFCSADVAHKVAWHPLVEKVKMLPVYPEQRFHRNVPLFTARLAGQRVLLEFDNYFE